MASVQSFFGEIETFSQFHQHFTSSFCVDILQLFLRLKTTKPNYNYRKLRETLLHKKVTHTMLMKWTPGIGTDSERQMLFPLK
jgi:hypothetical protein